MERQAARRGTATSLARLSEAADAASDIKMEVMQLRLFVTGVADVSLRLVLVGTLHRGGATRPTMHAIVPQCQKEAFHER